MSGAPAAVSDEGVVRVEHLRVEPTGASGEYRATGCCWLITPVDRGKEFKGVLELQIKGVVAGKDATISLPEASERNAPRYRVEFRYFQRLDGVFVVLREMRVQSVVVGLLQDGVARAKQPGVDDPRWVWELAGGSVMDLGYSFSCLSILGKQFCGEHQHLPRPARRSAVRTSTSDCLPRLSSPLAQRDPAARTWPQTTGPSPSSSPATGARSSSRASRSTSG